MRKGRFEVRILDPLPPLVWSHLRPNTGIPGIFPASREFGFRDGFARDCLLQRGVRCELDTLGRGRVRGAVGVGGGAVAVGGAPQSPQPLSPSSPTISTSNAPRRSYHACE
jgi:hypothetical protein